MLQNYLQLKRENHHYHQFIWMGTQPQERRVLTGSPSPNEIQSSSYKDMGLRKPGILVETIKFGMRLSGFWKNTRSDVVRAVNGNRTLCHVTVIRKGLKYSFCVN